MYIRIVSKWGPFGFSGQADFFPLGWAVTRNMPMKKTEVGNGLTLTHLLIETFLDATKTGSKIGLIMRRIHGLLALVDHI
jgi:hypothetical protein